MFLTGKKGAIREGKLSGLNLTHIMNTWTKQMGHPSVRIEILNKTHISLSQSHFLYDQSQVAPDSSFKYLKQL
jgi:hypothetical protein